MKKEFYVIELFKQYGGWSNEPYSYYKRRDGITPNLELARKYATRESASENMPKRKYPTAKIFHYLDGKLLEVSE